MGKKRYIKNSNGDTVSVTTEILGLEKPLLNENYDINVHNRNMDKIDEELKPIDDSYIIELFKHDGDTSKPRDYYTREESDEKYATNENLNDVKTDLGKTENTKYVTKNGVKEFECKNGYVDNVVIEGETLVNLANYDMGIRSLTESSGNIWTTGSQYGTFTNSNGLITFTTTTESWIDFGSIIPVTEGTSIRFIVNVIENGGTAINCIALFFNDVPVINSAGANVDKVISLSKVGATTSLGLQDNQFKVPTGAKYALFIVSCSQSNTIYKFDNFMLLENNEDDFISYFEGLKSVGQGDKIEVLSYNTTSSYDLSGVMYTTGFFEVDGSLNQQSDHRAIEQYIAVEEGETYLLENIAQATCYYDANKNVVGYCLESNICNSTYPHHIQGIHNIFYSVVKIPKGVKYIRVSTGVNSVGKVKVYKTSNYDHKQISTTLRSLPNGVKDTIEKRGNKYVKVQRCGEEVLNQNSNVTEIYKPCPNGVESQTYIRSKIELSSKPKTSTQIYCDSISSNHDYEAIYKNIFVNGGEYKCAFLTLPVSELNSLDAIGVKTWLSSNPITVVYELETPQIIELPNFNPQTYEGDTTLLLNTGVIQGECEFEVTNSMGSEIEVLKDKVSSLDGYESGYEYSNEIIYLNGTYKPSWAEDPYIVRIGKICILHCILANDATKYGLPLIKLPSFAQPKQHHRYFGRGKGNDNSTLLLIDYDIDGSGILYFNIDDSQVGKLNQLYVHAVWEVE